MATMLQQRDAMSNTESAKKGDNLLQRTVLDAIPSLPVIHTRTPGVSFSEI